MIALWASVNPQGVLGLEGPFRVIRSQAVESEFCTTGQSVIGLGPQSDVTSPKQFLVAEYNFQ